MRHPPSRGVYERALTFCRARRMFTRGDRVVVGSGSGAASLGALGFLVLAERDLELAEVAVAAVDPGGEDDAEAVADVGRVARQLGVTFHALSSEGRPLRAALAELAKRERYQRIALGHTRDDAVAHILAALLRRDGLLRARPLVARARSGVVRPLLDLRDAEALELARTAGIEPVALPPDPGLRLPLEARLRGRVLPRLRVEVPRADDALLEVGQQVAQLSRRLEAQAEARLREAHMTPAGLEIEPVGRDLLLSRAVARAALQQLEVSARIRRVAEPALARLLRVPAADAAAREVVVGAGLVATYLPATGVVAIRVMKPRRRREEEVSG